jgi:hypothetical protein
MGARRSPGPDLESAGQLGLELEALPAVPVDLTVMVQDLELEALPPAPVDLTVMVQDLEPGDRFILESCAVEGKAIARGPSSMLVSIRGRDDHWTQARWSLRTKVRRLPV